MKKPPLSPLVLVTCIFAAFTLGFFVGRNQNRTEVTVSAVQTNVPTATATELPTTAPDAEPETTQITEAGETTVPEDPPPSETTMPADPSGRININTATQAELMTLPGIGEVIAQRIIDYRTANGPYRAVEELLNVSGIGEKKLEAILDLVTVGG